MVGVNVLYYFLVLAVSIVWVHALQELQQLRIVVIRDCNVYIVHQAVVDVVAQGIVMTQLDVPILEVALKRNCTLVLVLQVLIPVCVEVAPNYSKYMKNLGDKIAKVAQPVAKTIDAIWGSDLENCSGCKKMQTNLNRGMSLTDAIWDRFWPKQQQRGNNMQFQVNIQVLIEADTAMEALDKVKPTNGIIIGFNISPRPQPPPSPPGQPQRNP